MGSGGGGDGGMGMMLMAMMMMQQQQQMQQMMAQSQAQFQAQQQAQAEQAKQQQEQQQKELTAQQNAAIRKQVGQIQNDVSAGTWNMLRQFGMSNSVQGAQGLGTVATGVQATNQTTPLASAINSGALNNSGGVV